MAKNKPQASVTSYPGGLQVSRVSCVNVTSKESAWLTAFAVSPIHSPSDPNITTILYSAPM